MNADDIYRNPLAGIDETCDYCGAQPGQICRSMKDQHGQRRPGSLESWPPFMDKIHMSRWRKAVAKIREAAS